MSGGVGLVLDLMGGAVYIGDVIAGGAAAQNGQIHRGDILVGINGQFVAGRSLEEIKAIILGPTGTPIELLIQRGGTSVQFLVVLLRGGVPAGSSADAAARSSAPHAPRPVSGGGGQRLGSAAGGGGGARSASEARALAAEAAIKRSTQAPKGFSQAAADKLKHK